MKAKGLVASDAEFGHSLEEFDVPIERSDGAAASAPAVQKAAPAPAPAPARVEPAEEEKAEDAPKAKEAPKEKPKRKRTHKKPAEKKEGATGTAIPQSEVKKTEGPEKEKSKSPEST